MPWLQYKGKDVDPETGDLVDVSDVLEVTGPVRVQAMTAKGLNSHELHADLGLSSVTLHAEQPAPGPTDTKKEASA